jgi:hypothetical protein
MPRRRSKLHDIHHEARNCGIDSGSRIKKPTWRPSGCDREEDPRRVERRRSGRGRRKSKLEASRVLKE